MEQDLQRQAQLSDDLLEVVRTWSPAFIIDREPSEFARLGATLQATRDEIYTAKLVETRAVFTAVASGRIRYLGLSRQPTFEDAVDLLRILATHSRIARAGHSDLRAPSFWTSIEGQRLRRPAIAVNQLLEIGGYGLRDLQAFLKPLAHDGAVHVIRRDAALGICLSTTVVDDRDCSRFLRR